MESLESEAKSGGLVDLSQLSLEQLSHLKKQLEQESQQMTSSYSNLRMAQGRFRASRTALDGMKPENEGKESLIPLTGSLYVPATLTNVDQVTVDIGTGYFVTRSIAEAKDFMDRKITMLEENSSKIGEAVEQHQSTIQMVTSIMQQKIEVAQSTPGRS